MRKIAIEQHFITRDTLPYAGSSHVPPAIWQQFEARLLDFEDLRLAEMDRLGIDLEVLSLNSPGIQCETDERTAIAAAAASNDELAGLIQRHPTRFAGFAALPTQNGEAAARELRRAVRDLGFKGGLVNGPTVSGRYLDDAASWPLLEAAEALGVPLYIHPAPPLQVPAIYEGYTQLVGPMWSWGLETATQVLRLVFAGAFDAFPRLQVMLGHMGEGLPYTLWRLDSRYKVTKQPKPLKHLPSEYIARNVAITTSGVSSLPPLQCALGALGADRILFATDYPFEDGDEAVHFMTTAPIDEADRAKIFHRNAERLLGL
jgi:2,3-dihydroxybenzoate decarboxylase